MSTISISFIFSLILAINLVVALKTASQEEVELGSLVRKEERKLIVSTEYGSISAVTITEGKGSGSRYHLQFISMDPNSLFLPVLLHADMIFYVHTGSGKLSWVDENKLSQVNLETGDVYRLRSGTIFYIQSSLEPERERLRINAIFANPGEDLQESVLGAYSSINDMIRGFDKRVLQTAFKVPEELIEEITSETKTPQIVHAEPRKKDTLWDKEVKFIKSFLQMKEDAQNKKTKTFNFFKEDPDFENCNGWSKVVTKSDLHALRGTHIGVYMVNLTKGSMMGPHWNPSANEISIVLQGEGMVRVVCPSSLTETECNNTRFRIKFGDVFSVPKYHPMTQISFNNDSLVFMGFSTTSKKNHPQFLAGKASVLGALDRHVLETSFDVNATTIDQLLAAQADSIILECISCAEGEERLLGEEIEKARQEEEARKRDEEKQRKREEEEARKREEEEQRKREEERRREAEARKREEEKQRRKAEEEEARKEEEEEQRKREEEEKERRREEDEQRREEKEARRREEKEARKREEEEARKREEEQRRLEEEEEEERRRQEEQRRRPEEEQRRQEKEERRRQERQRQEEEEQSRREEEERRREEAEEEQARREEEERIERQRQEEEASRRRREEEGREEHRGHEPQEEEQRREEIEQEQAAREEEERIERDIQEEEASRRRREEAREHKPQHKEPRVGEHIREKQSEERSRPRRKEIQSINKGGEMGLQARREEKAAWKPEPVSGEAGKYEEFIEKQEKRQTQISMREGRRFLKSKFKFGNAIKF